MHSHSIGQNSVKCLHQIARKATKYNQARYPRKLGNEFEGTYSRGAEESSPVQESEDWDFSPDDPFATATGQVSPLKIRITGLHCFLLHKII